MKYPRIIINAEKIRANTEHAVSVCGAHGIEVVGVTKACLGDPVVAKAMLDGGVTVIGDSRLLNLRRLRESGVESSLMMLRLPMLNETDDVADLVDISLNSDLSVIKALGQAASRKGFVHEIVLMIDTGDGREGIRPEDACKTAQEAACYPGIVVRGIGTNVACLAGTLPTTGTMELLAGLADKVQEAVGIEGMIVSGGNSSAWDLVKSDTMTPGINQVRLGEAILLGRETARGNLISDMSYDVFVIEAEIIESNPGRDNHHIAAIGRQDIDASTLVPTDSAWLVVKASSDHLVLTKTGKPVRTGTVVSFIPGYDSLLRSMTSPFVAKQYV